MAQCSLDETGEYRVAIARIGRELRMKLARDEPGMTRQLDRLDETVDRKTREYEPPGSQLVEEVVVEFVSVPVTLVNRVVTVEFPDKGPRLKAALL